MNKAAVFAAAVLVGASSLSAQVISEVVYDAPGSDDGQTFVEIYAPIGTDISGWRVQGIEGRGGSCGNNNGQQFVFPDGTVFSSNYIVVADSFSDGTTLVACYDFLDTSMDFENGGDAVHLYDENDNLIDAVAYGSTDCVVGEGTEARDIFAPLGLHRAAGGIDTDDNDADFTPNIPTPKSCPDCPAFIEWVNMGSGSTISACAGETVGLDIALSCAPNEAYLIVASCTDPSVIPPPAGWPVFDVVCTPFIITLAAVNVPPFVNWFGNLDANGRLYGSAALDFSINPFCGLNSSVDLYVGAISLTSPQYPTNYVTLTIDP